MPREVSDIKQFIEICRRKDAKCTSPELGEYSNERIELIESAPSRSHKAQLPSSDQIQSPVLAIFIHISVEGCREGGQAKAEFTSRYVAERVEIDAAALLLK